jgi:hypothetical protein
MIEFDFGSLERKFYDTVVPVDFKESADQPPRREFVHISGMQHGDDEATLFGTWINTQKEFVAHTAVGSLLSLKSWPRMDLKYWTPPARLYKVRNRDTYALVRRRMGKFFRVGLNNQSHDIRDISTGLGWNSHGLDLGPIQPNSRVWSEHVYLKDDNIYFNGSIIGIKSSTKIFLNNPFLIKLIPQWAREKWQIVY